MLEPIPTPAEFRDAIESLSPEQQRFAKAYRGMQLASTLFAVAVVQIKPQLERLLGLPDDRCVCVWATGVIHVRSVCSIVCGEHLTVALLPCSLLVA